MASCVSIMARASVWELALTRYSSSVCPASVAARRGDQLRSPIGGYFIARGGRYVQLEGTDRPRNVVAKFPSVEAAEACYRSPEYQQALDHARGASERDLLIVETSE